MARKGRAVTGVMRCIVNGLDMREACKVDEESSQHRGTDGDGKALAAGGRGGGG